MTCSPLLVKYSKYAHLHAVPQSGIMKGMTTIRFEWSGVKSHLFYESRERRYKKRPQHIHLPAAHGPLREVLLGLARGRYISQGKDPFRVEVIDLLPVRIADWSRIQKVYGFFDRLHGIVYRKHDAVGTQNRYRMCKRRL
jgi:hypothetical protein